MHWPPQGAALAAGTKLILSWSYDRHQIRPIFMPSRLHNFFTRSDRHARSGRNREPARTVQGVPRDPYQTPLGAYSDRYTVIDSESCEMTVQLLHERSLTPVFIFRETPRPPQWPPRPGSDQAGWMSSWLAQIRPDPAMPARPGAPPPIFFQAAAGIGCPFLARWRGVVYHLDFQAWSRFVMTIIQIISCRRANLCLERWSRYL